MTAAWVLDCHYNIVHVLSSPQTITTGVGVAKCWADLEILAQSLVGKVLKEDVQKSSI